MGWKREHDDVAAERIAFAAAQPALDADRFVFCPVRGSDHETGSTITVTRQYGPSRLGRPVYGSVPHNLGKNLTVIGARSPCAGLVAWCVIDGGMDGAAFLSFMTEALIPAPVPGQTVVMDNRLSHKTKIVRAAFAEAGIGVRYLPRYSPEWNPIELCWATVKRRLRRIGSRTRERLREAVAEALGRVTAVQVRRWVRHCGYTLTSNSAWYYSGTRRN